MFSSCINSLPESESTNNLIKQRKSLFVNQNSEVEILPTNDGNLRSVIHSVMGGGFNCTPAQGVCIMMQAKGKACLELTAYRKMHCLLQVHSTGDISEAMLGS